MYPFAIIGIVMVFLFTFLPSSLKEDMAESKSKYTALNYLIYRDSVHKFLFNEDENYTGSVKDSDIVLPTGFIKKNWSAFVKDDICFVYGNATDSEKIAVNKMSKGSHSIGEKRNGFFYPNHISKNYPLPNFIPEDALVSIMEVNS